MFIVVVLLILITALGWMYWGWIGALVLLFLTLLFIGFVSAAKVPEQLVFDVAKEIGVDPIELYVLALIESNLNPSARNEDAIGIMQVRPIALEDVNRYLGTKYTVADLEDPKVNLIVGGTYFRLLKEYFSFYYSPYTAGVLAVMAYNWGIGNVKKLLNTHASPDFIADQVPLETMRYVIKYVILYNQLKYGR